MYYHMEGTEIKVRVVGGKMTVTVLDKINWGEKMSAYSKKCSCTRRQLRAGMRTTWNDTTLSSSTVCRSWRWNYGTKASVPG
jgi:hypothetical protein